MYRSSDSTPGAIIAILYQLRGRTGAMAWLKQVVVKGYKDFDHLKKDADLKAVSEREDYKKLVKEMEEKK
jgi:hypothetical protein